MPIIGKPLQTGGYHVLDALSASSTNSYTMQLGSANFTPESANHLIVSLNGVIQKPGSAFTVSGSTLTFVPASGTLSSSDSIDFVIALGNTMDIGTPSDGTITNAKLASNLISGETDIGGAIADADLFLMDDGAGGTLRKTAASRLKTYIPGNAGTAVFNLYSGSNQSIANTTATKIAWSAARIDTASGADFTNNRWTVPSGYDGDYYLAGSVFGDFTDTSGERADVAIRINNTAKIETRLRTGANGGSSTYAISGIWNLNASDYVELFLYQDSGASQDTDSNENYTWLKGFKLNSE